MPCAAGGSSEHVATFVVVVGVSWACSALCSAVVALVVVARGAGESGAELLSESLPPQVRMGQWHGTPCGRGLSEQFGALFRHRFGGVLLCYRHVKWGVGDTARG